MEEMIDSYLEEKDWRVRENANIGYSSSALMFRLAGEMIERYCLKKMYPPEIARAHVEGDFHIHNLYMGLNPYCCGWSVLDVLTKGLKGAVESRPAKHFDTALLQLMNFVASAQNEWAGAQALNSLDTYLAPYIAKDGLDEKKVKQYLQQFVYNLNVTTRVGGQTPFTNITLDTKIPEDLKNVPAVGYESKVYGDFQKEVEMFDSAYYDVMIDGDAGGRPFTFPILTLNVDKEFFENGLKLKIGVMTVKYGIPYFANYLSTGWKKGDIRSMCCRLMLDLRELKQNITGGLFGSSDKTGSIGVVTINLPRIGYLAKDDADFFERLDYLIDLARASLEIKRTVVEKNLKRGLYPVSSQFLQKFDTYFSTIGIVGMHECCLNYLGKGIETVDGFEFALRVSKYIREKVKECQRETGTLFNYEATPAESCAYRLALLDKKKLGIDLWNGREPIYTSSTMLPANHDLDFWDAVRHQEPLQTLYTGGTVFHIWANIVVTLSDGWRCDMTDRYMNARGCIELVNEVFQKSKLPYVTITPTFGVCPVHGYLGPILDKCPDCGREVNVYSRVVGYVRPVKQWNPGKQEEFRKRKKLLDVSLEV